ncbi:TetR/AcrR family transcriptional regulator [Bradyrhizobium sp. U87765 SZCCT0131]|uniref:TetR/AcrR family transcriptional regulator n=1 Tax=unclassified Bradyrhizobium TaxID=2631580 RepID=UPI001BAD99FC|nr:MULTISPECIES: TetR/AcrR family transcriptional regulator [unclassified Bradyrhizobium]MBR1217328.1 TetR/AcrR family transcriptional regulator [Bradyrhizobium sp. U87765 SZCCT0131]MBR1265075.1 TetR/AcrR family transcriptional regulator [Bradyrhizobium sp. U87765 SZCCT0134]MBR1305057.1 TetR/AcrR family transcriptional regulator [Bradyrhizobium sp. U87765 SZCCT0110]MBR1320843.1 TetR/AcrR family transcriptional regulator [Bradyrhizobium sp. U87765 SZCCT0109]MBR1349263.1 TetR/AcrR family transcr
MAERGRPRAFDKEAALTRAMEVFWRKGYEGTSMTDLTQAMGIASPSLYAAFGSKEELFRDALRHYSATEGEEIWGGVPAAPTAFAAVESYLMSTARVFTRRSKPPGCLIVLSALHPAEHSDRVRQTLIAMRAEAVTGLKERLQQGIVDGEIVPTADIAAIAQYYVTVQQGMSIQARDGASRRELEAIARAALAAWPALIGAVAPAVGA